LAQAGKIKCFRVPRFGEIWWLVPLFDATENSHAIIYNLRENSWYDTVLPNGGRSFGHFGGGQGFPIMGGIYPTANGFPLWSHEYGVDQNIDGALTAIRSSFTTPVIGAQKSQTPSNQSLSIAGFEIDAIQSGDLTVQVIGSANQRSLDYADDPVVIRAVPQTPQDQIVGLRSERRQPRFKITSETIGGSYIVGRCLAHMSPSDGKILG